MPSSRGIRMSISTTSGRSRRATATACTPSPASPTTSRSGSASSSTRNPPRTSSWSSATSTRMLTGAPQRQGARGRRTRRPACGPVSSRPSKTATRSRIPASPLPRACRGPAAGGGQARSARPPRPWSAVHPDPHPRRRPAPPCRTTLVQRLLHDAVGADRDAGADAHRVAVDGAGRPAGLPSAHPLRPVRAGRRARGCGSSVDRAPPPAPVAPDDPQEAAHLDQRRPSGVLHRAHRLAGSVGVRPGQGLRGLSLHDHHRHPVGDHVVQLAGDPAALAFGSLPGDVGGARLHLGRPVLDELGPVLPARRDRGRPPRRRGAPAPAGPSPRGPRRPAAGSPSSRRRGSSTAADRPWPAGRRGGLPRRRSPGRTRSSPRARPPTPRGPPRSPMSWRRRGWPRRAGRGAAPAAATSWRRRRRQPA